MCIAGVRNFLDLAYFVDYYVDGRLLRVFRRLDVGSVTVTKVPAIVLAERRPTCSNFFLEDWYLDCIPFDSVMSLLMNLTLG